MQFMGSAKLRFIPYVFLLFVLSYFSYLLWDHSHQGNEGKEIFGNAKAMMAAKEEFNAVILGGSNAAFSLSAQQLNNDTKFHWFNFGLSSEAFTRQNYWKYIKETVEVKKRDEVLVVVYSSIALLRSGYLKRRAEAVIDMYGNVPLGKLPKFSLASRIKNEFNEPALYYPLPTRLGDFNFDLKECDPNKFSIFERERDLFEVENWLFAQTSDMKILFPNAQIIIVIPSEYYSEYYDKKLASQLVEDVKQIVSKPLGSRVKVFAQKPYLTAKMTCDAKHHANAVGRKRNSQSLAAWLLENLI